MRLAELCEPIFQWVVLVNRSCRRGKHPDKDRLRAEIKNLLEETRAKSVSSQELSRQFEAVYKPLVFFVDSMIRTSSLPFALDWDPLQAEFGEMAGDDKFFICLEEALQDTSEDAQETLAIYYNCIGLGFTGRYAGQPQELKRMMGTLSARLRNVIDMDESALLCPEAYENVETRDLGQPIGGKLGWLIIGTAGVIFLAFILLVNFWRTSVVELDRCLLHFDDRPASAPETPDGGGRGRG